MFKQKIGVLAMATQVPSLPSFAGLIHSSCRKGFLFPSTAPSCCRSNSSSSSSSTQKKVACSSALTAGYPDPWYNSSDLEKEPLRETTTKAAAAKKAKMKKIAGIDQDELLDPWLLADPDSRFAEFHGVQIHYKMSHPVDELSAKEQHKLSCSLLMPAILLHGFGASLFSWERVMKPLAQLLRSKVISFDRPAFGLTSRVRLPLAKTCGSGDLVPMFSNPYTVGFSAAATIAFIDFLQANKAVLIGHSAGCIVAVDAYLKAPERVAAIIMVAPAFMAPLLLPREEDKESKSQQPFGQALPNFFGACLTVFRKLARVFQMIGNFIAQLWSRMIAKILRSGLGRWLVRVVMDKLSLLAVRNAWYDRERVDEYVIAGYTKPLRCRDWEYALLEYTLALSGNPSTDSGGDLNKRLQDVRCPVLILTGDSDTIIPAWNAHRLAKVFNRAECHVIKNCGHLPHEEKPEEFLTIIENFVRGVQQDAADKMNPSISVVMPA